MAILGFIHNNLSNTEIRYAKCFEDKSCKGGNKCISRYDKTNPFIQDYFCCCDQTLCNGNGNYDLVPSHNGELGRNFNSLRVFIFLIICHLISSYSKS